MKFIILLVLNTIIPLYVSAKTIIYVGSATDVNPPFTNSLVPNSNTKGIISDLVTELNKLQSNLYFEQVKTSARRRCLEFKNKTVDLIFLASMNWGWKKCQGKNLVDIAMYKEVYITKSKPNINQTFFNDLKHKNFVIMRGFHYGFANFNSDENYLKSNFHVEFSSSYEAMLKMILNERGDVGVVPYSYIKYYSSFDHSIKNNFFISNKIDSSDVLSIIGKEHSTKFNNDSIIKLFKILKEKGTIIKLFKKYKLEELLL